MSYYSKSLHLISIHSSQAILDQLTEVTFILYIKHSTENLILL
jgi:hypothetical protein